MANPVEPKTGQDAIAVTKSDTTVLRDVAALFVGGAGDVTVRTVRGTTVAFVGVLAGSILPIAVDQVRAATTATNIVAITY